MSDINNHEDRALQAARILTNNLGKSADWAGRIIEREERKQQNTIANLLEENETRRLRILTAAGVINPISADTFLGLTKNDDHLSKMMKEISEGPSSPGLQLTQPDYSAIIRQSNLYDSMRHSFTTGPVSVEIVKEQHDATVEVLEENNRILSVMEQNIERLAVIEKALKRSRLAIFGLAVWSLLGLAVPSALGYIALTHADAKADRSFQLDEKAFNRGG